MRNNDRKMQSAGKVDVDTHCAGGSQNMQIRVCIALSGAAVVVFVIVA
jgi:hypothetical protein